MRETDENCPEYLFIACRSSHFPGRQGAARLHELARQATRNAGLRCYWTSENCVTNESIVKTSLDV